MQRFERWLEQARQADLAEPAAMTLATVRIDGGVSARTVLLKQVDREGFVFYTNSKSRKGRHLQADARVALCFTWAALKHQVLVEGRAHPVSGDTADNYWRTRPRESQLGALASHQSELLSSRGELEQRFDELKGRFEGKQIPRPDFWSGFRVVPELIEFWSGRESRLHERVRYTATPQGWRKELLNP